MYDVTHPQSELRGLDGGDVSTRAWSPTCQYAMYPILLSYKTCAARTSSDDDSVIRSRGRRKPSIRLESPESKTRLAQPANRCALDSIVIIIFQSCFEGISYPL